MFDVPEVSDHRIDRYLGDELDGDERAAFEAELSASSALRARVDELRASRMAFSLSAPSFEAMMAAASSPLVATTTSSPSTSSSSSSSSSSMLSTSWWRRVLDALSGHTLVAAPAPGH
jgi:anti-sigma factor RsiW